MAMQPFLPSLWQTLGMGRSEFYRLGVGEQMRVKQEVADALAAGTATAGGRASG